VGASPAHAAIAVLEAGITFGDDGSAYPTVVLDVAGRPDVADLARVYSVEGIGDVATSAAVTEAGVSLTVRLTRPVRAAFSIAFVLPDHLEVLVHAAVAGMTARGSQGASSAPPCSPCLLPAKIRARTDDLNRFGVDDGAMGLLSRAPVSRAAVSRAAVPASSTARVSV
jgi:hypothetical protein